jgi:hypothetical protein
MASDVKYTNPRYGLAGKVPEKQRKRLWKKRLAYENRKPRGSSLHTSP